MHNLIVIAVLFIISAPYVKAGEASVYAEVKQKILENAQVTKEELEKVIQDYSDDHRRYKVISKEKGDKAVSAINRVIIKNELFNAQFEKNYLVKFRQAFEKQDVSSLSKSIHQNISFSELAAVEKLKMKKVDGLSYGTILKFEKKSGEKQFLESFKKYFAKFRQVEFVETQLLNTYGTYWRDTIQGQNNYFLSPLEDSLSITADISLEVRGITQDGFRRTDKSLVTLVMTKKQTQELKIDEVQYSRLQSVRSHRAPAFESVAGNAGFDDGKVYPRLEALRRGGYAFAVEDFDQDGNLDAFVGNYGDSTVWRGTEDGSFKQVPMPEVNKINLAKAAALVDLDNDGWKDLVITRFASDQFVGDVFVFKNNRGKFVMMKDAFPSNILRDYAMPMAIADFNNDSLLDVYIGFPGVRDFSAGKIPKNKDLAENGLFINKGGFKFVDQTSKMDPKFVGNIYPHGSLASDFDMDGKVDIMVMDDQRNLSPIYRNNGDGTFSIKNNEFQIMNLGYGMGISAGDFNNDGRQDYAISNATFTAQDRMTQLNQPVMEYLAFKGNKELNKGLRLYLSDKKSKTPAFNEVTNSFELTDAGEGAGGVTVLDYDNDGLQDIYLVNGLWSGSSRDDKIDSFFAQSTSLGLLFMNHLLDNYVGGAAKSMFMRILMNEKVKDQGAEKTLSFAGHQRNRLFKNLGDGQFIEVGYQEGIDSLSDGYMSVVADLNKDGKPDLMLRNCDPGAPDHMFAPIEIFKNRHENKNSVWITLKGNKSNTMGVGAKLYATIGNQTQYREIFANNSATQGEVSAHFGMGKFKNVKKLKIVWPSGLVNIHTNLKPGRYQFEEQIGSVASAR